MDKNKVLQTILFILLLLILGLGTYYLYSKGVICKPKVTEEKKDEQGGYKTDEGLSFELISPLPNSEIECGFTLAGKMPREWFFENSFPYSIIVDGKEVLVGSVQSKDDYTVKEILTFSEKIECKEGCLGDGEIVLKNANPSGLPENADQYRIPVKFTSTCLVQEEKPKDTSKETVKETPKTVTVKVYFANSVNDPDSEKCETTYAVSRTINETVAVGKASLTELLKGPNTTEKGKGYYTSIPTGTELKSINIKNGVAYVDFNEKLTDGIGGSCLTSRIRSQIENTLKQFPTVKEVVIQVNGKSEGVLES